MELIPIRFLKLEPTKNGSYAMPLPIPGSISELYVYCEDITTGVQRIFKDASKERGQIFPYSNFPNRLSFESGVVR